MFELSKIYGRSVMMDDTIQDMGVPEVVTFDNITDIIQDSKEYYGIIHDNQPNGMVNIVTWSVDKEYHGMQYNIKLIRIYSIDYISNWNHTFQRRSGGEITITQSDKTGFYIKFIGNSLGTEQLYADNLIEYGIRQMPTFGTDKQKLEERLFTIIDKIRSEMITLYFNKIDAEIERLQSIKTNCVKMFALDTVPW